MPIMLQKQTQINTMFSKCFGLPEPTTKDSISMTRQLSDGGRIIDYSPAYVLQDNVTRLQKNQRSMLKEIINIISKFSQEITDWQDKWNNIYQNHQSNITSFKKIWELFGASISAIDIFSEQINDSIEKLKDARRLIPPPDREQSLKFKIMQARASVDKLENELERLKNEEHRLERRLERAESNSSKGVDIQTHQDLLQRQQVKKASIANKEKLLARQKTAFYKKQATLFEESKEDELRRCRLLKRQSNDFVEAFDIESVDFQQLFGKCNVEDDLIEWETNIFLRNINQSNENSNK